MRWVWFYVCCSGYNLLLPVASVSGFGLVVTSIHYKEATFFGKLADKSGLKYLTRPLKWSGLVTPCERYGFGGQGAKWINIKWSPNQSVEFIVKQTHQVLITPLLENMVYGLVKWPTNRIESNHWVRNILLRHGGGASSNSSLRFSSSSFLSFSL